MSGPKTSRYTLTPEQRRILAEQRKIEQRKAAASENIKRTQKKLLQIGGMFENEKQVAAELAARTGTDNGAATLISELETLIASTQPLVAKTNFDDVNSVERTSVEISPCLKKAEDLANKIAVVSAENESILKANLQDAIDRGFSASFADITETDTNSVSNLKYESVQKLTRLKTTAFLPQSIKDEISEVTERLDSITDDVFLKNFIALTVNPLIKKANLFISEYAECSEEFEQLYSEYAALCELYYYTAQEYVCSRTSIQALQSEIKRIKDEIAEDDEQSYISECLDEVMTEMGYSVLGSREVTKRSGKHFRNELYSYGEGTPVNITYSSDGKIVMELGGIDTSDRIPTAQETEMLCDSMEQFCDDFKEIEKRLFAKGVVLADRVSLLPPDAEYAQIINTSDYSMSDETETIHVAKQHRHTVKQKALRKE